MKRFKRLTLFALACAVILALACFEQTMVDVISIYGLLFLFTAAVTLGFYLMLDGVHSTQKCVTVRLARRKNSGKR
ncbi:MAG: hypothetical protein P1P90_06685 [Patescibacteria group bacterium]|nr:hypothetical protein [Patescibacteria group bacterium]